MTFPEFLAAYRNGALDRDAAWRAYDIPTAVRRNIATGKPTYVRGALKALKLAYAGELAMPEFCARYGVDLGAAPLILGAWWLWSAIDAGRAVRVPLRLAGGSTSEGAGKGL